MISATKLSAIAITLALAGPALACPMCKESAVENNQKTGVADTAGLDFNHSIYAMLGGLVSIIGVTGRVMYKAAKSV